MRTTMRCKFGVLSILIAGTVSLQEIKGASFTPISKCTVDGLPTACDDPFAAVTGFFDTSDPAGVPLSLDVFAEATAGFGNTSASASIDLTFWARSAGPVRPGLVSFIVHTEGDGSLGGWEGTSKLLASIPGLGSCADIIPCTGVPTPDPLPFTLGVPFQIQLLASIEMTTLGDPVGWNNSAGVRLWLWELGPDGTPGAPVDILAPVIVPEPGQFGAVLLGIGAGVLWKLRSGRK